jgi:hypothetical protein
VPIIPRAKAREFGHLWRRAGDVTSARFRCMKTRNAKHRVE